MLRIFIIIGMCLFTCVRNSYAVGSTAFRLEVLDSEAVGKGNAFAGEADNAAAVYYNPAGLMQLKGKTLGSFGISVLQPYTDYESPSGGEVQMRRNSFFIPHSFFVHDFGLEDVVFGIGSYSGWGTATEWAGDSFSRYVATKSELENIDSTLVVAYQCAEQISFGLGIDYAYSKVSKNKKLVQLGGTDGDLQLKGVGDGWGYRLATLYKINDRHQWGLQYRSPIDITYKGKIYLNQLNSFGLDYRAIFGDTTYETETTSGLKLPRSIVAGYSYRPNDKWIINLDVEWMDWASIEQERLVYESEMDPTRLAILNDGNPASRDWRDAFSYGLGVEHQMNERFRFRGGYTFKEHTIPEANFETTLPDFDVHGVSVGYGYDIAKNLTLDMSYTAWFAKRKIDNAVGASNGASIDGTYKTFFNVFMGTLSYEF